MFAAELRGANKPNLTEALGWIGSRVDDIYGTGVGRLEDVWIDPGSGAPRWLLIKEGRFGGRTTLIPFEDATAGAGHVWIPYERDVVREAPEVEPGAPLTQQVEAALRRHFAAHAPAAVGHSAQGPPTAPAGVAAHAGASPVQHAGHFHDPGRAQHDPFAMTARTPPRAPAPAPPPLRAPPPPARPAAGTSGSRQGFAPARAPVSGPGGAAVAAYPAPPEEAVAAETARPSRRHPGSYPPARPAQHLPPPPPRRQAPPPVAPAIHAVPDPAPPPPPPAAAPHFAASTSAPPFEAKPEPPAAPAAEQAPPREEAAGVTKLESLESGYVVEIKLEGDVTITGKLKSLRLLPADDDG